VDLPDYAQENRRVWQGFATEYVEAAEISWAGEPKWGIWGIPEADVALLPPDLTGRRCIELGCGTAYVSAWLARRGGTVIGLDPTPNQLATARAMQRKHQQAFPLVEGFGERLPFPDDSFDFAISEYGAALWADPYLWIPEAARVLQPGGELVFLTNSPFAILCSPDHEADGPTGDRLMRPYFGIAPTDLPSNAWLNSARRPARARGICGQMRIGRSRGQRKRRGVCGWRASRWVRRRRSDLQIATEAGGR
jgi:SAM-dependent methyltransferase